MTALLFAIAAAAALEFVGWWLLAVVTFVWGVVWRAMPWPALRIAAVVLVLGVLRLGIMTLGGAPVVETGSLLSALTELPTPLIWSLALLLPALVACCAATLGAAVGRKVLFG